MKFAIFGTGFWSRFQLAGWRELEGAECVALYNRTRSKAEALGREFGVEAVYDNAETLLGEVDVDFVDIITDVDTHAAFTRLAAEHGKNVICQKPLGPDLDTAREMKHVCDAHGVVLYVHENWRWQRQIREFKRILEGGRIGEPWRARIMYNSSFPVFENQPFLAELEQFILTDIGTHILDALRFLFGEAETLYCQTHRVNPTIKGEDAASVSFRMRSGVHVNVEMSYASRWEEERFPQTYFFVEGENASLELRKDFEIHLTDPRGTWIERFPPPLYPWVDPEYAAIHSSIVDCNRNLLAGLNGTGQAETTAEDNLNTLQLVYTCYDSAAHNRVEGVKRKI